MYQTFSNVTKKYICQGMHNVMIGVIVFVKFFFVRFLVFELLSILYFTVVNSDLDLTRVREIA